MIEPLDLLDLLTGQYPLIAELSTDLPSKAILPQCHRLDKTELRSLGQSVVIHAFIVTLSLRFSKV